MALSQWWTFYEGMVNSDRSEPGVYEFGDASENVIYIGSSNDVKRRLQEHLNAAAYSCIGWNAKKYRIEYTSNYKWREKELYDEFIRLYGRAPQCNDVAPSGY